MNFSPASLDKIRTEMLADARRVARQAQSVVRWRALLWFLASAVLLIVMLLVADCVFQREEAGLRWLRWVIAVAASLFLGWRLILPAWKFRCTPLDVALSLESKSPHFHHQLSVAVELAELSSDDPKYGSSDFRDLALADWLAGSTRPQWKDLVRWEEVHRALIGFSAVAAFVVVFFSLWPDSGWQASKRLWMPWSDEHWPKKNLLAFVDLPVAVGYGTSLQVEVRDLNSRISEQEPQPALPDDIVIEIRESQDRSSARSLIPQIDADVARTSLPPLQQDVELRATGGDDRSMPWHKIRVMAIPQWKSSRFDVTVPDYIRLSKSARKLLISDKSRLTGSYALSGQRIEVPLGSRVHFGGELDRSVREVHVNQLKARPSGITRGQLLEEAWSSRLDSSGTFVRLTGSDDDGLLLQESIQWSFGFHTTDGCYLESPYPWKIEVVPDRPPEVLLETALLTSIAIGSPVPISAMVRDDWGVRDVTIKLSLVSIDGYSPNSDTYPESMLKMPLTVEESDCEYSIQTYWDFATELSKRGITLRPQDQVLIWIESHDHLGQLGKSQVERWSVEEPDRQLELLSKNQNAIAKQLQELLEMQDTGQQLARMIHEQLSMDSVLQSHLDAMAGVEQLQRAISRQLSLSPDAIGQQIKQTLQLLEQNRLAGSELHSQLKELLEILRSEGGPQAEAAWNAAIDYHTALQSILDGTTQEVPWQSVSADLERSQAAVLRSLQVLVEKMDSSQALNRLRQELQSMASQQEVLSEATKQAQLNSLRDGTELVRAQLSEMADQQSELTQKLEKWTQQTHQFIQSEPVSSSQLRDQLESANQVLTQSQTAIAMREASKRIQSRQFGSAIDSQQSVTQALREAIGLFDQIETELETTRDQSKSAMEIMAQQLSLLRASLGSLIAEQGVITSEYQELSRRMQFERGTEGLLDSARTAIDRQETLRSAVGALSEQSDQLAVFQWVLDQAASDMGRAAAMARRRRFDPEAISSSQDALYKLSAILESLAPSNPDSENREAADAQVGDQSDTLTAETPPESLPLANLKLIRALQLELERQTQGLKLVLDPARQSLLRSELAGRQQELGDQLRGLMDKLQLQPSLHIPSDSPSSQGTQP